MYQKCYKSLQEVRPTLEISQCNELPSFFFLSLFFFYKYVTFNVEMFK